MRALVLAKRGVSKLVTRKDLEMVAGFDLPNGKPPAPSSSGAPLALPGPGYWFDIARRSRRGS
jgi:hypothetical protein